MYGFNQVEYIVYLRLPDKEGVDSDVTVHVLYR